MIFGDWRTKDISLVPLEFQTNRIYLLASRAVGLKGHLFRAKHTYVYWFSKGQNEWLNIEINDHETIEIQKAKIVHQSTDDFLKMAPFVTHRKANQKWFGSKPKILDSIELKVYDEDMFNFAINYPIKNYQLIFGNCNTFTSYLNYQLESNYKVKFNYSTFLWGDRPKFYWDFLCSFRIQQQQKNLKPVVIRRNAE